MFTPTEQPGFSDRMDMKWKVAIHPWFFGAVAVGFALGLAGALLYRGYDGAHEDRIISLIGGVLSICGGLTTAIPMIRAGGYRALYERDQERSKNFTGSNERLFGLWDYYAVQVVGQSLIAVGAFVSSVSGFFS